MVRHFTELPPLSLYVHIPWCIRKCPYCDFNSHEQRGDIPEASYIDALLADLADELPLIWGRTISTVFIGGGTPSLFSAAGIDRLMSGIRALTALSPSVEVTLEANPGTFEQQRFKEYHTSGINRLSIGIQSFNSQALKKLGRVHSSDEAIRAVDIAHTAGFDEINLDLMFALPEQLLSDALNDVTQATSLKPTHLSCYELTLEPNTLFARFPPVLPDEDLRTDMQNAIIETLHEAGFDRYEVSAYALNGSRTDPAKTADVRRSHRSEHNLNYWQFGDYIGIGAGAHGKITSAATGTINRRWKHKHPSAYLKAQSASERLGGQHDIPLDETALEFMMNALRLIDGFPIPLFELRTGTSMLPWQTIITQATDRGLLQQSGLNLHASPTGINWLNEVLELFLPNNSAHPSMLSGVRTADSHNHADKPLVRSYPVIPLNIVDKH